MIIMKSVKKQRVARSFPVPLKSRMQAKLETHSGLVSLLKNWFPLLP